MGCSSFNIRKKKVMKNKKEEKKENILINQLKNKEEIKIEK